MSTKVYFLDEIHRMSTLPPTLQGFVQKICALYKYSLNEKFAIAVLKKKKIQGFLNVNEDYEFLIQDYKQKKKKIYLRLCLLQEMVQLYGMEDASKVRYFDYDPHAMLTESMITVVNED